MTKRVVVAVATRGDRDLSELVEALRPQAAQSDGHILVVVNSHLQVDAEADVSVVRELQRGYSHVRNAALKWAIEHGFHFLAFIDDDAHPSHAWLPSLMEAQGRFDADAVFGPVVSEWATTTPGWIVAADLPGRPAVMPDGPYSAEGRTGNTLIRLARPMDSGLRFDPLLNRLGGEDVLFFRELRSLGATFVWAQSASVREEIGADRARVVRLLERAFRNGRALVWINALGPAPRMPTWRTAIRRLRASGRLLLAVARSGGRTSALKAAWELSFVAGVAVEAVLAWPKRHAARQR